jgi:hypothetical protein
MSSGSGDGVSASSRRRRLSRSSRRARSCGVRGSGSLSKAVIVWRRVLNGSRERFEDMRTTPVFGCCFLANRRSAGRAAAIQRNGKFLPLWSRSALGTISHPVVHWWRCARKFPARRWLHGCSSPPFRLQDSPSPDTPQRSSTRGLLAKYAADRSGTRMSPVF